MFLQCRVAKFNHGFLFTESELRRERGDIQQQGRPDKLRSHDNEKQM